MDRPPPECISREMRVLNADGSLREVVPPSMTPDERDEADRCKREDEARKGSDREAVRRDRNLVARYPNEAAHAKARALALDDVKRSIAQSEKRLAELAIERKPLTNEAEFYVGRQMPLPLKQSLDANDAATAAQRSLIANRQDEVIRINALFDTELARLKRLWAGVSPGSLDPKTPVPPGCVRWLSK